MSADFSQAAAGIELARRHQDGLTGVARAVFLDRGGHAPGERCPRAVPPDAHLYWCQWPDDECGCSFG